jgi:chromosome condensin MukBEF ATPase and DNA-binding subunit MukB
MSPCPRPALLRSQTVAYARTIDCARGVPELTCPSNERPNDAVKDAADTAAVSQDDLRAFVLEVAQRSRVAESAPEQFESRYHFVHTKITEERKRANSSLADPDSAC